MNNVNDFINHFHSISKTDDISEVFTCGCCYWFAFILCSRFKDGILMYDPIYNHFVTKINNKLFDITGDVTGKYNVIPWDEFSDTSERKRIIKYCVNFTEQGEE